MEISTQACAFCEWTGPQNDYPRHISEECDRAPRSVDTARARTDGGQAERPLAELDVGVRVVDQDADRPVAVVVDVHPDTPADEHVLADRWETVAEANPKYDPRAPVVTVALEDELAASVRGSRERRPRSWQSVPELASAAENAAVDTYDLPAPRLEVVE